MAESDDDVLVLPALPIKGTVLYPNLMMPLVAGRPRSIAAAEAALAREDKTLILVAQKDANVEEPKLDDLYTIGTQAVVKKMERTDDALQLVVQGTRRVALLKADRAEPYLEVRVRPIPDPQDSGTQVEALHRAIVEQAAKIHAILQPQGEINITQFLRQFTDPLHQAYLLASMLPLELEQEQQMLQSPTRAEALELLHQYLTHEVQVLELRQEIANEARTEMSKEQREYMLRQQMRAIQDQLGEQSPEQAEAGELRRRFDEADLPENVRKEASRELSRLERLPTAAPDYQITRSYLELILELPWRKSTEDNLDLRNARQVLDADHHGLKDVKDRIIEHLAVLKLNPTARAPILTFVGPPGVGKTSLGQSIARSLGRKFERISLGGLHDESELRGHRRTYIGALPGRIIQAIRRSGVNNPMLMLDEVDKMGQGFHGDPAAALLEILDPAQNHDFRDNYLDLPFDLSKVFFITTANTLSTLAQPLLDRMEVIRLAGYSDEEKSEIARRYLIPRQRREAGLTEQQFEIPDETLQRVIRRYTREAGVRQLERTLGSLARKAAVRFAEGAGNGESLVVRPDDLGEMLGPERFMQEEARKQLPPGVATGLAWTEAGGEVLYIEAVVIPHGKGLTLTGQLGHVMQESARAAQSYVWSQADQLGLDIELLKDSGVHVHVPAGAVPKDGPSAGVAMATAITSAYTRLPVAQNTAMTGEITLTGLIFPVGGIKEKVLAAHRAGIRKVILPKENAKDLPEIPQHVRDQLEIALVERVDEALAVAISGLAERSLSMGV